MINLIKNLYKYTPTPTPTPGLSPFWEGGGSQDFRVGSLGKFLSQTTHGLLLEVDPNYYDQEGSALALTYPEL